MKVDLFSYVLFAGIFADWTTIISLLLREGDGAASSALRPAQVAVLLYMFAAAALRYHKTENSTSEKQALRDALLGHLPSLLSRFRDNTDHLAILMNLLQCCDFSSNAKGLKTILNVLGDILRNVPSENVLTKVVRALYSWSKLIEVGGSEKGRAGGASVLNAFLKDTFSASLDALSKHVTDLSAVLKNGAAVVAQKSSSSNKSRGSKAFADSDKDNGHDIILSLSQTLKILRLFWQNFDCRSFSSEVRGDCISSSS
jgi:hypothetical protein